MQVHATRDGLASPKDEEQQNDDTCSNDPSQYEGIPPPSKVDPLDQAVDQWEGVCTLGQGMHSP